MRNFTGLCRNVFVLRSFTKKEKNGQQVPPKMCAYAFGQAKDDHEQRELFLFVKFVTR